MVSTDKDGNHKGLPQVAIPEFDPITQKQEGLIRDFIAKQNPEIVTSSLPTSSSGSMDGVQQHQHWSSDPVQRHYVDMFDNNWRTIAHKFLVSRKWNVADAMKMYRDTTDFRRKQRFHEGGHWPPACSVRGFDVDKVSEELGLEKTRPNANEIDPSTGLHDHQLDRIHHAVGHYHPKVIHFWDKTGHPICIEKIPKHYKDYLSAFKGALIPPKTIAEAWEDYHWHQTEVCNILCKYQNRMWRRDWAERVALRQQQGEPIDAVAAEKEKLLYDRDVTSVTVVMDCADLGYGILFSEVLRLSDKVWSQESKAIPEGLHRIFLVNCPSIINIAFGLMKHVVPKRTQEKIVFCCKDKTREVLMNVIDTDKLPKELGGTCECVGGCLGI